MKHPELPPEHCANQSPDKVMKMFVHNIAPELKSGSINARSAISQLEVWRNYHPEVFADWKTLCWTYVQQPPEWVDWLIKGVTATSDTVTKADDLVAAALADAASRAQPLAAHGANQHSEPDLIIEGPTSYGTGQSYLLRRLARDAPEVLDQIGPDKEFKSARAAAIEAGIIKPVPTVRLVADMAAVAGKLCQHLTLEQRIELIDLLAPDL